MTEKYVLEVDIDHETGEEHCTVLKTDGTNNMTNWIEIVSAIYTHHSILEPLVDELNKIHNGYDNTEKYAIKLWKENKKLKVDNNRLVNETAKIVAEHQGRVLDLIDKSLEKDKQYYEMSYEDYLNGRIEALEELKKELQK